MRTLCLIAVIAGCTTPPSSSNTVAPAPSTPAPSTPEPSKPEPSKPEPSKPEPSKPEPSKPEPAAPATSAKLGDDCSKGQACGAPATCVSYLGIAGARGPTFKSCEIKCTAKTACPTGTSCLTIADGPGQVCR